MADNIDDYSPINTGLEDEARPKREPTASASLKISA